MATGRETLDLEAEIATIRKENTRLKNELRFSEIMSERKTPPAAGQSTVGALRNTVHILEARNDELATKLLQTEKELQATKLSLAKLEASISAKLAGQGAALVERLSSSQRQREKSLLSQWRTAFKGTDTAMKKIKDDMSAETSLQAVLEEFQSSNGVSELHQSGSALIQKVKDLRTENEHNLAQKMKLLREDKENALSKARSLEDEVCRLQKELVIMQTEYKLVDKTRVRTLQAQLQAALCEKDIWQQKALKFEDTCETLQVLSSLQRSLSKEDDIKHKYDLELARCHAENAALTEKLEQLLQERNTAVQDRNQVIHERNSYALQAQQEYERAERFQRLVIVLRKKAMNM